MVPWSPASSSVTLREEDTVRASSNPRRLIRVLYDGTDRLISIHLGAEKIQGNKRATDILVIGKSNLPQIFPALHNKESYWREKGENVTPEKYKADTSCR